MLIKQNQSFQLKSTIDTGKEIISYDPVIHRNDVPNYSIYENKNGFFTWVADFSESGQAELVFEFLSGNYQDYDFAQTCAEIAIIATPYQKLNDIFETFTGFNEWICKKAFEFHKINALRTWDGEFWDEISDFTRSEIRKAAKENEVDLIEPFSHEDLIQSAAFVLKYGREILKDKKTEFINTCYKFAQRTENREEAVKDHFEFKVTGHDDICPLYIEVVEGNTQNAMIGKSYNDVFSAVLEFFESELETQDINADQFDNLKHTIKTRPTKEVVEFINELNMESDSLDKCEIYHQM